MTRAEAPAAPRRTCVGCGITAPQSTVSRFTRTADGRLLQGREQPGRGAWVCAGSVDCLELAWSRRGFSRTLRGAIDEASFHEILGSWRRDDHSGRPAT